jgi:uncharacterized membrane protein YkvA (DUF1232 family)
MGDGACVHAPHACVSWVDDTMMGRLREWAGRLQREIIALWFCARHPDTPFIAKVIAAAVVAYAVSPIDLVPDFIPVLGYLDDLIIVPAGIWLVLKLIPDAVLAQCREQATRWLAQGGTKPRSRIGAVIIIALWGLLLWLGWRWAQSWLAW